MTVARGDGEGHVRGVVGRDRTSGHDHHEEVVAEAVVLGQTNSGHNSHVHPVSTPPTPNRPAFAPGRKVSTVPDALAEFDRSSFSYDGMTHDVYRAGTGPCVIVLAEVPGITPAVANFARAVIARGCSVALPHLFGVPGGDNTKKAIGAVVRHVCVSKEFTLFATGKESRVTSFLRALASSEHVRCGGPGVGVVGMCLTGGFGLAMLAEPAVIAPVLSQPSLPVAQIPVLRGRANRIDISPATLATVQKRVEDEDLCVLGLRFTNDPLVPAARFAYLREVLGDHFVGVEIDSSPGNAGGHPTNAHSVLTEQLVPDALDQVLDFLTERLQSGSGSN
jgi:dienelactone hydrolase